MNATKEYLNREFPGHEEAHKQLSDICIELGRNGWTVDQAARFMGLFVASMVFDNAPTLESGYLFLVETIKGAKADYENRTEVLH